MQNQTGRAEQDKQPTTVNPTQVRQDQKGVQQKDPHKITELNPEQVEKNRPADPDPDDPVSP